MISNVGIHQVILTIQPNLTHLTILDNGQLVAHTDRQQFTEAKENPRLNREDMQTPLRETMCQGGVVR